MKSTTIRSGSGLRSAAQKVGISAALASCLCFGAYAQLLVIDVGNHILPPNSSGTVELFVRNAGTEEARIAGLTIFAQIADGEDSTLAPSITDFDLVTDTIFASNNNGPDRQEPDDALRLWGVSITVFGTGSDISPILLAPNQTEKLGTLTISTIGFSSGEWALNVGDTRGDAPRFIDPDGFSIDMDITDGMISVVPEPSSMFAVAGVLLGVGACVRRSRRGQARN